MERAIVTGGAGFIGSNLVDKLLEKGIEVLVVDDLSTGLAENLSSAQKSKNFRLEQISICDKKVTNLVESFKPQTIFHLAAQANVRKSVSDPDFDADTNIIGTIRLLEACKNTASTKTPVKKFIFASTGGAIYGEQLSFPADEQHQTLPESPYGLSKRAGEYYLEYYARTYNFTGTALRFANVYGPRQNPKGEAGVVAIFIKRLLENKTLHVNGNGEQTRDFIYVDDVIAANIAVSNFLENGKTSPKSFDVFNVGTGIESTVNQIAKTLTDFWTSYRQANNLPVVSQNIEHGSALPGEQLRSVISAEKLFRELAVKPQYNLQQGLELTFKSFL